MSISRTSTGNNFYFCSICNITFILLKVKVWNIISYFFHIRACLKNHSRNLHAPLCGIFCPNSVAVARYGALIRAKSPTNCDAHLAESLFQTRSGACLKMSNSKEKKNTEGRINNRNDCFKRAALHAWKLTFCHPFTDEIITLEAPLPDDFCRFLNANEEEKT